MQRHISKSSFITGIGLALSLLAGNALADKPHWAERNKHQSNYDSRYDNKQYKNQSYKYRKNHSSKHHFHKNDRRTVYNYYGKQQHRGKCPPGLTKKNNSCQPSKRYKKWHKGKTLSKNTRYYELPRELRAQLSRPQDDYRYVRVDNDILLIDRVTDVVIDAIENAWR